MIHVCNTVNLLSQVLFYEKYSTSSDVWSYGILMYQLWSLGKKPFSQLSLIEVSMLWLVFSFFILLNNTQVYKYRFIVLRIYYFNQNMVFLFFAWALDNQCMYVTTAESCDHETVVYNQRFQCAGDRTERQYEWLCMLQCLFNLNTVRSYGTQPT